MGFTSHVPAFIKKKDQMFSMNQIFDIPPECSCRRHRAGGTCERWAASPPFLCRKQFDTTILIPLDSLG